MLERNKIYNGDCLELMKDIPDKSIDMILCDLPYGMTDCKWDVVIPFDKLWEQYNRITKKNAAIILTAIQPFASMLIMSNLKNYRYEWIWEKDNKTGFLNAKKYPLRAHENILLFANELPEYYPQMTPGKKYYYGGNTHCECYGKENYAQTQKVQRVGRFPISIIKFKTDRKKHPTGKPVPLFEYFIRTYSQERDLVLDNCIGSGTTAIACINTKRDYIGIEKENKYYLDCLKRIENLQKQKGLF